MKGPTLLLLCTTCLLLMIVVYNISYGAKSLSFMAIASEIQNYNLPGAGSFGSIESGTSSEGKNSEAITSTESGIHDEGTERKEHKKKSRDNKPLNVVVLYPDDMRYDSLSGAGTQVVKTPFLDQLAAQGMRFPFNCVTTSICWISRATLFTGQYNSRHKSSKLNTPYFIDEEERWNATWPYLLQQAGYFVGHIGKWQYQKKDLVSKKFNWTHLFEGRHWHDVKQADGSKKFIHTTDFTKNSTLNFLRDRPQDTPFAVTVAFYPPKGINGDRYFNPKNDSEHLYANMTIPEPFDMHSNISWKRMNPTVYSEKNLGRETWRYSFGTPERYQKNIKDMYRLISEVDQSCREIFEELKRQQIENDTLVIFTTDNGMMHGEHGIGGKWFPWEESIRVPLIVWDPRMPEQKRGTLDDSFTLNIDLASTILGAANLQQPLDMQGRDIAGLYLDEESAGSYWRKEFFYEHPQHVGPKVIPASSALVRKDLKLMRYDTFGVEELYHLPSDPMEQNNVIDNPVFMARLSEMRKRYGELKQTVALPKPFSGVPL